MDSNKQKKISDIIQTFNRQISQILKIVNNVQKNNIDVEWFQRILRIIRNENPPLVLEKCIDKFWDNREKIINRDVIFFMNGKQAYSKFIKNDERKEWIEGLIDLIQLKYKKLTNEQTVYIWDKLNSMLQCIIQYRILIGDFT
jgi:hypothetical protein